MAKCPSCDKAITHIATGEMLKSAALGQMAPAPGAKIGVFLCPICSAVLGVAPDTDEIERAVQAAIARSIRRP